MPHVYRKTHDSNAIERLLKCMRFYLMSNHFFFLGGGSLMILAIWLHHNLNGLQLYEVSFDVSFAYIDAD